MTFIARRRHLFVLGIAAAAVVMAAPQFASAQQRPGGGFANNPGVRLWNTLDQRFDGFAEQLSLTEAQTLGISLLVENFREENKGALGRYETMMAEMRNRARGARSGGARAGQRPPNRQGMRGAGGALREILQELGPAFEALHTDVTAMLEDDQADRMRELLARQRPGG